MKPTLVTAIHEAGHAVARLVNSPGPMIRHLTIVDLPPDLLGIAMYDPRWMPGIPYPDEARPLFRRAARLDVIEALAGSVAQYRQQWRDWAAVELHGFELARHYPFGDIPANHDLKAASERLDWLQGEHAADGLRAAWSDTVQLVRHHWRRIDELGRWLLADGRIEGDDVHAWWDQKIAV